MERSKKQTLFVADALPPGAPAYRTSLYITDHAIVRYLERVKGLDIEAIKREMLPSERAQAAQAAMGEQAKIIKPQCTLIVKSGKVVTVTVKR